MDRAWRKDIAARAAFHAITANQQQGLLSWTAPLSSAHEIQSQPPGAGCASPPRQLLLAISSPLQAYGNPVVSEQFRQVWQAPSQ